LFAKAPPYMREGTAADHDHAGSQPRSPGLSPGTNLYRHQRPNRLDDLHDKHRRARRMLGSAEHLPRRTAIDQPTHVPGTAGVPNPRANTSAHRSRVGSTTHG